MSKPHNELESRLARLLGRQNDEYFAAQHVLGSFASTTSTDSVPDLQRALESFQRTQAEVDDVRREWQALNHRPGAELQAALDKQQQLLEQLLRDVDEAQIQAGKARQRLVPGLDKATRSHKMQSAYARAVKVT